MIFDGFTRDVYSNLQISIFDWLPPLSGDDLFGLSARPRNLEISKFYFLKASPAVYNIDYFCSPGGNHLTYSATKKCANSGGLVNAPWCSVRATQPELGSSVREEDAWQYTMARSTPSIPLSRMMRVAV